MITEKPQQLEEIQQFVRQQPRVVVRGGGSKPPLHAGANLDLAQWTGVVEYDPSEYTFTARSGTRLKEIRDLLATHDQFLPFDPILVERGATIGGTVASGCAGSGRFRYGGVRDFLLGVQVINGEGDLVRGGGKVVKNAAGFDIPKLMVGGLGRFGVMVEMTFKVFPRPQTSVTLEVTSEDLATTLANLTRVALSPAEVFCLDLIPPHRLLVRICGWQDASVDHLDRVRNLVVGEKQVYGDGDGDEEALWREARELTWVPPDSHVIRVPLNPSQISACEQKLRQLAAGPRRYAVGGNLLWLTWPANAAWSELENVLKELGRPGLVVLGPSPRPFAGPHGSQAFAQRLRDVFDPQGKFENG